MGRMLQSNTTLQVLKIRGCYIPPFSACAMFRSLKQNTTLQELDLSVSWGMFDDTTTGDFYNNKTSSLAALAETIAHSTGLTSLNLRNTRIGSEQVRAILDALAFNKTLESLDVSENDGIGLALVDSLIQYLPNMRLQVLNAELTGISECLDQQETLMQNLATAMEANKSLWKLMGIVLHKAEFYTSPKERAAQLKCIDYANTMDYYKTRNGAVGGNWLLMEKRDTLPNILADVMQGANRFANDLVFFLLREKCDWLNTTTTTTTRTEYSGTAISSQRAKCDKSPKVTAPSMSQSKKRGREKASSADLRVAKKAGSNQRRLHPENTPLLTLPVYYCFVHASCKSLPRGCCSFERRRCR